jgi:hypothetical protein
MPCLGLNNGGTIAHGKMDGSYMRDLRIEFVDATNCLYQGQFMGKEGKGGYMCFADGGRMIEQGSWRLRTESQPTGLGSHNIETGGP